MKKGQPCAGIIPSPLVEDRPPIHHQGVPTGLTGKVNDMASVTPSVGQPAALLREPEESRKENSWMALLGAYPVNILSGQTHIHAFEWIPPVEEIEKRLEKVLVLSNKSFPRSVAVRQVAMKLRNWALKHGKQKAAELALEHFGGTGK